MNTFKSSTGDSDMYLQLRTTVLKLSIINSPCSHSMFSKQRFDTFYKKISTNMRIHSIQERHLSLQINKAVAELYVILARVINILKKKCTVGAHKL